MAKWPYSTARWSALRAAKLSAQPLCEVCIRRGRVVQARAVDHIAAIAAGGDPFPPLSGLMSMCEGCHSYKTNHEDRPDRKRKLGSPFKGSAVDGGSLDPMDEWNSLTEAHTAPLAPSRTQVPENRYTPPRAAAGDPMAYSDVPGGLQGRGSRGQRPAGESKTELVANDLQEGDWEWV